MQYLKVHHHFFCGIVLIANYVKQEIVRESTSEFDVG